MQHFVVMHIASELPVHYERVSFHRDISQRASEALEPGTVFAKGGSYEDALHNARVKARKAKLYANY